MLNALWARLLAALEGQVPEPALASWLRPCRLTSLDGDHLHVGAPNPFTRDWAHTITSTRFGPPPARYSAGTRASLSRSTQSQSAPPSPRARVPSAPRPTIPRRATRSSLSWSAPPTSSLGRPARPSPSRQGRSITPSSSTEASAWARPTSSTRSATRWAAATPPCDGSICPRRASPTTSSMPYGMTAPGSFARNIAPSTAAHRRHPVHRRQGAHAGGVLPHLQRPPRGPQADRRLLRCHPEGDPRARGPAPLPLRVGADRRHPAARR